MHRGQPDLDRRRFLRTGSAALGLAALPGLLPSAGQGADDRSKGDPYGGFTVGVQSYTFRKFPVDQALQRIQDLGLRHVELYPAHAPLNDDEKTIRALLNLCKEHGVTPRCWGVQSFTKDHDKNKRIFDFGKALGLGAFSADPDPDSFDSLDKLCEEYQIAVAIHPHGPTGENQLHRWYSAEVIRDAVKDHHRLIGACLDTGHLIRAARLGKKLDPAEQVRVMKDRNFGLHLKDHDNADRTDVVFGRGALDVPAVLRALRDVHFQGMISIEYEAHADDPSPDVRECLAVFKESVKKLA
jgi:sugar phosphate isomerase/epimerase